jgi:uncharacterized protein
MKALLRPLILLLALLAGAGLRGAETIPPAPARYFNDYAGAVPASVANELNSQLEQFERDSSNQLLVAVFPRILSDSSVEDYTVRVAQAWRVGQRAKNNGAVLFVFMAERQLYIQVGYGLEAALPDATAHDIIESILKPAFRANDYAGGLSRAVAAMIAATKGEYRGTGRTLTQEENDNLGYLIFAIIVLMLLASVLRRIRREGFSWVGGSRSGAGWHDSGGSWGGGSSGGGFSGGGGSFGGGGAGGKW